MRRRAVHALCVAVALACGGHSPPPVARTGTLERVVRVPGHPPVATLERRGDPSAAVSMVVDTSGTDAPGSTAVALAAVLDRALTSPNKRVTAQSDAVRVEAWVDGPDAARRFVEDARGSLSNAIDDAAWAVAKRALDNTPARSEAADRARRACIGQTLRDGALAKDSLEAARVKLLGAKSIAFGVVAPAVGPIADALSATSAWPEGARQACVAPAALARLVYPSHERDALTRLDAISWTTPASAIGAASDLGGPSAPVSLKLHAADPDARLSEISAVAHPSGGCVDVRLDVPSTDPALLARDAALLLDELARGAKVAATPSDPRDAATVIAMTELAHACTFGAPMVTFGAHTQDDGSALDAAVRAQLEPAMRAWAAPQIDARKLVETGQAESLVLVASRCGTRVEDGATAGATAALVDRMARGASKTYRVIAEPFVAFDAAGLLVRGRARDGESERDFGERLADAAARSFFVDAPAPTADLPSADQGLSLLAQTLAPNHMTWIDPFARAPSARPPSQLSLDARLGALRHGPVRAVVVSSANDAQADAMVRALDRYFLRGEARACASDAHADAPKPGTYVTNRSGATEAYLALPVAAECGSAADALSALLRSGLLARALSGTARSSDAHVLDAPSGRWLTVHVDAPNAALDAAVAQTRALFARLHDGAIADGDVAIAQSAALAETKKAMLDPRVRAALAWRAEPAKPANALEAIRACARATLRDEALVIVASRPGAP